MVRAMQKGTSEDKMFDKFCKIIGGHILFQTLSAAVEFDLFSLLAAHKRLTAAEIAENLGIEIQPCRIMLLGLVCNELLVRRGSAYSNSRIAAKYLDRKSATSFVSYVKFENDLVYKGLASFHESVRHNTNLGLQSLPGNAPTLYKKLELLPELRQTFQAAMQELSRYTNKALLSIRGLERSKFVVDVGGGNGTNLIALAKRFPRLHGAVFDLPEVCEMARKNIKQHGLGRRLKIISGDVFRDELPKEADFFLFCHFFTMWSKDEDRELLRKAFAALPSGGRAAIFNMMQNDDERGPASAAIGSPYFLSLASGKGMLYTGKEYRQLFRESGFSNVRQTKLPRDHGIIVGTKR